MIVQEKFKMPFVPPSVVHRKLQNTVAAAAAQLEFIGKLGATMMVGQMNGSHDEVGKVFDLLSKLFGSGQHLRISLAMASAVGGDVQPARDLLAENLEGWLNADAAKVSLAMALKVGGDPQWAEICQQMLAVSNDNDARLFAAQLLED